MQKQRYDLSYSNYYTAATPQNLLPQKIMIYARDKSLFSALLGEFLKIFYNNDFAFSHRALEKKPAILSSIPHFQLIKLSSVAVCHCCSLHGFLFFSFRKIRFCLYIKTRVWTEINLKIKILKNKLFQSKHSIYKRNTDNYFALHSKQKKNLFLYN